MNLWRSFHNAKLTGKALLAKASTLTAEKGATIALESGATQTNASGSTTNLYGTVNITTAPQIGTAGSEAALTVPVAALYTAATITEGVVFVDRGYTVSSIYARPATLATTAANLTFYKVPAGTTGIASGSQLSTGVLDLLTATLLVNKVMGITATTLATGDGIGYVLSGTPTAARGWITFNLKPS